MLTFGQRLRSARLAKGMTQKELAAQIGAKNTSISNWEKDLNRPDPDTIAFLCGVLDVTADDLLPSTKSRNNTENVPLWGRPILSAYKDATKEIQKAACAVLSIPHVVPDAPPVRPTRGMIMYEYSAAAGLPLYVESDYERIEVPEDEIPAGADFGIKISGDSMEPTIKDGSAVWVHKQSDIRDGEIGIFMLNDSAVCKRARTNGNNRIKYLESDNPSYEPISGNDLDGFRVVGRVLI